MHTLFSFARVTSVQLSHLAISSAMLIESISQPLVSDNLSLSTRVAVLLDDIASVYDRESSIKERVLRHSQPVYTHTQ